MRSRGVVARVPAKVNLQLAVGPLGNDGFHEVTTVFQAISLFDDVTVATAPEKYWYLNSNYWADIKWCAI